MKSTRTQIAIAAALLLGLGSSALVGTPAFADTAPATAPPAVQATTDLAPPAVTVPVVPVPAESAPPVVVPSPEPEPVETAAPPAVPVIQAPAAPAVLVTPATSGIPVVPDAPRTFPPLAAGHPARYTPGWTGCWETEANRTDVNLIDPLDMRTWPVYVTPSQGQPGYIPHFEGSEGSDIWTQVSRDDPRFTAPPAPSRSPLWRPTARFPDS